MAWNILVMVNDFENNFKFWSYSDDNWVAWGRIGTNGTRRQYPDGHIERKVQEKLREGYRVFAQRVNYHSPPNSQAVRDFWDNNSQPQGINVAHSEPIPSPEDLGESDPTGASGRATELLNRRNHRVQSSEEVNEEIGDREIRQEAPAPRTRQRRTSVPRVDVDYETNAKGFIKKYRNGYERLENKNYTSYSRDELFSSVTRTRKAKKFYESIPTNMLLNKREFGNTRDSQQTHGRYSGKHIFIFDEEDKCVGFFELNSSNPEVNFLYIKTREENQAGLIKSMMNSIGAIYRADTITIRTKGATIKESMKRAFEWNSSRTLQSGVTVWKINRTEVLASGDRGQRRFVETMW